MTCGHRLWEDVTGLTCTRAAGHSGGHSYAASAGPDLARTEVDDD